MNSSSSKSGLLFISTFISHYFVRFPVVDVPHQEDTVNQRGGGGGGLDDKTGEERTHYLSSADCSGSTNRSPSDCYSPPTASPLSSSSSSSSRCCLSV